VCSFEIANIPIRLLQLLLIQIIGRKRLQIIQAQRLGRHLEGLIIGPAVQQFVEQLGGLADGQFSVQPLDVLVQLLVVVGLLAGGMGHDLFYHHGAYQVVECIHLLMLQTKQPRKDANNVNERDNVHLRKQYTKLTNAS
jgi:hypothetical protein